ncbi:MAG TPA: outer membrane protein assembly factor BamE [Gammaproteobacteria bacterium]|nr:outer membrane protein assembly factor BamE [Gammaproteobacteria bacterium]
MTRVNPGRPLLPVILIAAAVPAAWAAGPAPLAQRMDQLTRRVKALETQVRQLQNACAGPGAGTTAPSQARPGQAAAAGSAKAGPSAAPAPARQTGSNPSAAKGYPWRAKEQWRSLKADMTADQVENLLGKPSRTFKLNGDTVWYYRYPGVGAGSVMIRSNGSVAGWQRPPFGWW